MKEIVNAIAAKHKKNGIDVYTPATIQDISLFEKKIGFALPVDFVTFYTTCNGLGCNEDIFNIIPLADIMCYSTNYGANWFYFAEYMIYSDMWGLRLNATGSYEIFNGGNPTLILTSSMKEFLNHYLTGNVFDPGGLYDWQERKLKEKSL